MKPPGAPHVDLWVWPLGVTVSLAEPLDLNGRRFI